MFRSAIIIGLLVSLSSVFAESYPDGEKVSTMNNELVEVGKRNRYHYNYPRYNVSANPFGILTGSYSVAGSYAVHPNFAVRGEFTLVESEGERKVGTETALGTTIYFKKMYSGFFLEPGFVYRNKHYGETNHDVYGPQALVGYTWFWDSGLNISLAAGLGRNLNKDRDQVESDEDNGDEDYTSRTFGNGYLKVGYAF